MGSINRTTLINLTTVHYQDRIPTRLNIGILSFLITFISYVLRSCIVLSMLAMVNPTNPNVTAPDVSVSVTHNSERTLKIQFTLCSYPAHY